MQARGSNAKLRAEVERIVREVLAELLPSSGRRAASRPEGRELVLTEKVVSAKELERRLEGVTRVVVPRGAIITPAARDLLKERGVAVASAVD